MKKPELIETLAARTNESNKTVESFLNAFTELVIEKMKEHETIDIYAFGKNKCRRSTTASTRPCQG